jgi:hypothetical protein
MFAHTFVAPLRCIDIGRVLLDFLEKCVKWHLYAKFEFHSICTYLGRANSICMDPKCFLNIFYKLQSMIVINHQKGEIKSASRPLVDISILNDNLIKGLISCVKCISKF